MAKEIIVASDHCLFHQSTSLLGNGAAVCGFSVYQDRAGENWRVGPPVSMYNIATNDVLQMFFSVHFMSFQFVQTLARAVTEFVQIIDIFSRVSLTLSPA